MPYEQLIVDRDGAVATVRMNNAARLNALSTTLSAELMEAMARRRGFELSHGVRADRPGAGLRGLVPAAEDGREGGGASPVDHRGADRRRGGAPDRPGVEGGPGGGVPGLGPGAGRATGRAADPG